MLFNSVAPKKTRDGPLVIPLAEQGHTKRSKPSTSSFYSFTRTNTPISTTTNTISMFRQLLTSLIATDVKMEVDSDSKATAPSASTPGDATKSLDQLAIEALIKGMQNIVI